MPTPRQLEQKAEAHEAEAVELEGYLKATRELAADFEAAIAVKREEAARFRRMAKSAAGTSELLTNGAVKSRVNSQKMHAEHKLAISKGQAKRDKRFKDTIRNATPRYTQAVLAQAIGMQPSLLSMCRSGERAMYLSRARRIEALTGWPADKGHWPGGIIEDA